MPDSSASELGLHCLHNSPKRVSGLKRVKDKIFLRFDISKGGKHESDKSCFP